jgi:hypothetical protein
MQLFRFSSLRVSDIKAIMFTVYVYLKLCGQVSSLAQRSLTTEPQVSTVNLRRQGVPLQQKIKKNKESSRKESKEGKVGHTKSI